MGTFLESKQAPIHRWFQYPAGFSYRAVEYVLDKFEVPPEAVIFDPFSGSGTTAVVSKGRGHRSLGVEAHPFVSWVAQTKVDWNYPMADLTTVAEEHLSTLKSAPRTRAQVLARSMPALVRACYSEGNLRTLLGIRESIRSDVPARYRSLFELALVSTLRRASSAATGWPYIAPGKRIREREALSTYSATLREFVSDLVGTPEARRKVRSDVARGDARRTPFPQGSVDFAFTSPPYLNNYDYADRTRLETYFLGQASSWADITRTVRTQLIVSATTQVTRTDVDLGNIASPKLQEVAPRTARRVQTAVTELGRRRRDHGVGKSYDLMVGGYFNDMTEALAETRRLLRPGGTFALILGDSAPYAVHIPTETWLGEIGVGVGFRNFQVVPLRVRGTKWAGNPQRHHVPLRESLLVLQG